MKKNLISLTAAIWLLFCGCDAPDAPAAVDVCGIRTGEISKRKSERRLVQAKWGGHDGEVEIFATPVSYTIFKVDFLIARSTPENVEALAVKQWDLPGFHNGECRLKAQSIRVSRAFELGVEGVRLSVTDIRALELLKKENSDPQAAINRRRAKITEDILLLEEAGEHFFTDNKRYPRIVNELAENLLLEQTWRGPYITALPRDPWGRDYQCEILENGTKLMIFSTGADGKERLQ